MDPVRREGIKISGARRSTPRRSTGVRGPHRARYTSAPSKSCLVERPSYTAMILEHADPKIVEAIVKRASRGTAFAAANPIEMELATLLRERVLSLDRVRFCNSGTEATMFAMRLARDGELRTLGPRSSKQFAGRC